MSHTQRHPIYTHLQVAHYRQAWYNSEHNSEDRLSALLFSRIRFYLGSPISAPLHVEVLRYKFDLVGFNYGASLNHCLRAGRDIKFSYIKTVKTVCEI